jgi:hypothetical protein
MAADQVANMTMEELKSLIAQMVDERLKLRPIRQTKDDRSVEEVLAAMDRIRWTPPPGSRSTLEMIREDR